MDIGFDDRENLANANDRAHCAFDAPCPCGLKAGNSNFNIELGTIMMFP